MNANDLKIGETAEAFVITAVGRANFEYAVPIRELVNSNEGRKTIRVDLKECTAMDSTFMGVLSMGGLKAVDNGSGFEIYNASDLLKRSLAVETLYFSLISCAVVQSNTLWYLLTSQAGEFVAYHVQGAIPKPVF